MAIDLSTTARAGGESAADGQGFEALPWLHAPLHKALNDYPGHALLVQGAVGDGLFEFTWALGQGWLCEAAGSAARPCGHCEACHLFARSSHPDQSWLMPQELALARGLPVDVKEGRKPSRAIRVDDVRGAIARLASTTGRGRGRCLVLFPGEALQAVAANALLKTLEEPPAGTRIALAVSEPQRLLPTLRSRCQILRLPTPDSRTALAWLQQRGVDGAEVLLRACSRHPLQAAALHAAGFQAQRWLSLPGRLLRADAAALAGLGLPMVLDALGKLCHDAWARALGGSPRFFPESALPEPADAVRLAEWQRALQALQAHADHPWNEALVLEALASEAAAALRPRSGRGS